MLKEKDNVPHKFKIERKIAQDMLRQIYVNHRLDKTFINNMQNLLLSLDLHNTKPEVNTNQKLLPPHQENINNNKWQSETIARKEYEGLINILLNNLHLDSNLRENLINNYLNTHPSLSQLNINPKKLKKMNKKDLKKLLTTLNQ